MRGKSFHKNWVYYPSNADKSPLKTPQEVMIPHDAVIGMERIADTECGTKKAFFPNGRYIYQKEFTVPKEWNEKQVFLLFEGIYRNAKIYVNNEFASGIVNGYSELFFEITSLLQYGKKNTICVEVHTGDDSRWYTGAGIYRNVQIFVTGQVHIAHNGVKLTTQSIQNQTAAIGSEIKIENKDFCTHFICAEIEFTDAEGKLAAKDCYSLKCRSGASEIIYPRIYIKDAKLWGCKHPNLYICRVRIREEEKILDEYETTYGIRMLTLDPENGLCINGEPINLFGGCLHHDNGLIGAVSIQEAEERKIKLLRSAGYNAIRCAHNPASTALLNACDKYGMTVMDEFSDVWNVTKSTDDDAITFELEWERNLTAMIERDYNHPSVILYSIGNEIPEAGNSEGAETARRLSNKIRHLDSSRFITCGINGMISNLYRIKELIGTEKNMPEMSEDQPLEINSLMNAMGSMMKDIQSHPEIVKSTLETMEALDVAGYNYAEGRYLEDAANFTNWISVGTETFPKDLAGNWKLVLENSNILGDYSWTSWDYLGEVGIGMNHFDSKLNGSGMGGSYPYAAAYCGDFDLTGRRRPQSYYREIIVGHRKQPYIAVRDPKHYGETPFVTAWSWFPVENTWTFHGCEGMTTEVEVYSTAEEVELVLNGKPLCRKKVPKENTDCALAGRTTFEVVYETGRLQAIAYENGEMAGNYELTTADQKVELCVSAEKAQTVADENHLAYLNISFRDAKGIINTQITNSIAVTIQGAGELYGFGTGNPILTGNYKQNVCEAYQGEALLIVRPTGIGTIYVKLSAEGFEDKNIEIVSSAEKGYR